MQKKKAEERDGESPQMRELLGRDGARVRGQVSSASRTHYFSHSYHAASDPL